MATCKIIIIGVFKQINKGICLDEYLVIQILADMVSVVVGYKPTDTSSRPSCLPINEA